jgi:heat-inducible transcriptional repressor
MMIADRDLRILQAVIDLHVRDGAPVSSRAVREFGVALSTATIRDVMSRLEDGGYLNKPHTSAGRVPTDKGYRAYVDHLEERVGSFGEFARRLREEIREQDVDVRSIMAAASRALGSLSTHFAVVYGSVVQESRVKRVQLVDLEGQRLLAVVHLLPEHERTTVIRVEKKYSPEVIARAESWINALVGKRTLTEAKEDLERAVRDNVTDEGIITREVSIRREDIFSGPPAVELYFEERAQSLGQPEFSDPRLLKLLLRLLHDKELLVSILARRLTEQTRITIGSEHEEQELRRFSLVTAGYRLGASRGVLGVIGPTRMRYAFIRDLVGSAAHELGAMGERYF